MKLGITDAPVTGVKNVFVTFSGIELHGPNGVETLALTAPKQIDLLSYTGTRSAPLFDADLVAGNYQWIRLMLDEDANGNATPSKTYLVDANDAKHALTVPSADQTGLKLGGFTLSAGGVSDFTIDFDVRKSLVLDHNGYKLKPKLRVVDNLLVGSLTGTIGTACTAPAEPVVYVYSGTGVTPDDIGGTGASPVTTAVAKDGAYTVGFLEAGAYTVTYTCDSDAADQNDAVAFVTAKPATITAAAKTTLDF